MLYQLKEIVLATLIAICCLPAAALARDGNTPKIGEVRIVGTDKFRAVQLQNWLGVRENMRYSPEFLLQRSQEMLATLRTEGHYFASVDSILSEFRRDSTVVDVTLFVTEGREAKLRQISLHGVSEETREELGAEVRLRSGQTFREDKLKAAIEGILRYFEERGHPYCQVRIQDLKIEPTDEREAMVDIVLQITPGPRVTIGEITVVGNQQTKEHVIVRELPIQEGMVYDQRKVDAIKPKLARLGYFKWVNPPQLVWQQNRTGRLIVEMAEGNYNQFNGVIGYNPGTATQDGFVTGLIDISFGNLFGTGRQIDVHWQKKTEESQDLRLRYVEPWVAGIPLNAGASFEQEIQDTIYVQRSLGLDLRFVFNDNLTFFSDISKRDISPDSLGSLLFGIPRSSSVNLGVGATLNTLDDLYNPRGGVLYQTSFEWGRKTIDDVAGVTGRQRGSFNQKRLSIDFENYFSLFRWQVIALALHGRQITSDERVVPITEQYRLGGTRTLRGYREDLFRGSRIAWANLEYRYLLDSRSRFFAFFDFGYYFREDLVEERIREVEDTQFGYGIGLRLETRLGFLGIDYGLGEGDGLSQGKIHIGLTNAF